MQVVRLDTRLQACSKASLENYFVCSVSGTLAFNAYFRNTSTVYVFAKSPVFDVVDSLQPVDVDAVAAGLDLCRDALSHTALEISVALRRRIDALAVRRLQTFTLTYAQVYASREARC